MHGKKSALQSLYTPEVDILKHLIKRPDQGVKSVMDEIRKQDLLRAAQTKLVFSQKVASNKQQGQV